MEMPEELHNISRRYRNFALHEAQGNSAAYYRLAMSISSDVSALARIFELPEPKRQPNLVFACLRKYGLFERSAEFIEAFDHNRSELIADILCRRTQTNEPARCAALYLALTALPDPISLIELGASAGLCMIPDAYRYRFNDRLFIPSEGAVDGPIFDCALHGRESPARAQIEICWRRGVDLHPINLKNDHDVSWLETLIWPGQDLRLEQLRAAISVARKASPMVETGDLLSNLERLAAEAPDGSTKVVYHSAVMNYLEPQALHTFASMMKDIDAVWISIEDPRVFPGFVQHVDVSIPKGRFLMAVNGAPLAHNHPHGGDIVWFG